MITSTSSKYTGLADTC